MRPLLAWIITTIAFACYYLSHYSGTLEHAGASGSLTAIAALTCLSETPGEPLMATLYLSVHNGLVVSGLGRSEKLAQSYACLYGNMGKDYLSPQIPDAVAFAGLGQTVFSAVLIFLLLLALRNLFRIK